MSRKQRNRESDRLAGLWDAHAGSIYAYAARRVGQVAAPDVVSETFIVAWRRLDAVPADAELPWLYGVARNVVRRANRSSARRLRLSQALANPADEPSIEARVMARNEIAQALDMLGETDREILLLSAWEGLQGHEIAKVTGLTSAAVRMRLSRTKRTLSRVRNKEECLNEQ